MALGVVWRHPGDLYLQAADAENYRTLPVADAAEAAPTGAAPGGPFAQPDSRALSSARSASAITPRNIKRRKLTPPACWADLIKPEFKGEVQMADPSRQGTAWTMLATIVQLMGEDKAFDYMKVLHRNINEYTKAGAAPALATGQGETLIGIAFQHDLIDVAEHNKPVAVVSPCEGTGYEIGSLSLIAGAKHMDEAKKFYDWALTPEAQKIAATTGSFEFPSNPVTPVPPEAPDLSKIKLIEYDFVTYGSSGHVKVSAWKWTDEVKNAPKIGRAVAAFPRRLVGSRVGRAAPGPTGSPRGRGVASGICSPAARGCCRSHCLCCSRTGRRLGKPGILGHGRA